jgi:F-type H+-transporting ATPase subunit alpha
MMSGVVRSAFALTAGEKAALEGRISQVLGCPVALLEKQDSALIAGIAVEIGGRVFDGSLKGHLARVERELMKGAARPLEWDGIESALKQRLEQAQTDIALCPVRVSNVGGVITSGDGVAMVSGLPDCVLGELIEFDGGASGIAMNLDRERVGVALLGSEASVPEFARARGTGRALNVPCGQGFLGRVVNPLGEPLDGKGPIRADETRPIEAAAPSILSRRPVDRPLETGLVAIDAIVPIGRGQRELIIGDRQTGKTAIAADAIINQKGKNVACFYVAIGQKASSVARLVEHLRAAGALDYTTIICSTASDAAPMQYIAPYAGCAMAEHFMYSGRDALIVYDDLTKHAVAYRAMSLILHRPPGREAYPGDVFYLHSRLLERAANLCDDMGGGSMTALPIVETQSGDISAYIPTNVISITDGQVFLDTDLFRSNIRPAVSGGLSVSRVGGAAQSPAMRLVAGKLRLELAQYRELQVFAQFSSDMDASTRDTLRYGGILTELLRQKDGAPMSMPAQVALLYAAIHGLLPRDTPMDQVQKFKRSFPAYVQARDPQGVEALARTGVLTPQLESSLAQAVREWLAQAEAEK